MVKTRHRGDDDDDNVVEFMSLPAERPSRRNSRIMKRLEQSRDETESSEDPDYSQIDALSQGRKMTRSGRVVARPGRLSPELVTSKRSPAKILSKKSYPSRKKGQVEYSDSDDLEEEPRRVTKSRSKIVNGNLDEDEQHLRRSTRHRRLLYDTFNTSLMDRIQTANSTYNIASYERGADGDKREQDSDGNTVLTRRRRRNQEVDLNDLPPDELEMDMYSKVKRTRLRVKRDMYGIPITEEGKSDEEEDESSDESEGGDVGGEKKNEANENEQEGGDEREEEEEEEEPPARKQYFLRENKPRTQIYDAGPDIRYSRPKKFTDILGQHSPVRRKHLIRKVHKSPAVRSPAFKFRRRAAFHGSSSTSSSSSSSSSDDEERFQRRKAKSMAKSRTRCLPMNLDRDDVAAGVLRDRQRIGSSLADVDPMAVDRSVNFESVGGLGKHIRALKEMIVFPLMYPEVFERFKIQPPRGVLFYGPPGTGKTLVARALANECSQGDRKVAFFMRKGADCLSKWVGESERQLRLLFDQAYQMRPAIIFFDEIDGLAPVRSSRQDQIHSSIVSTLLALMDGLDSRGEIVVIGATNRIDSIDPALRRPGRFDREFLFPLPSLDARKQILKINTKAWNPKLADAFVGELAEKCVGYCGADVRALCTEAALFALRRRYPQIYTTNDKLQLDVSTININARDFHYGMQNIVPTAQRSIVSPGRSLSPTIEPLMRSMFELALDVLGRIFPSVLMQLKSLDTGCNDTGEDVELYSDDDENEASIYDNPLRGRYHNKQNKSSSQGPFLNFQSYHRPATHRPRLLLSGQADQGQSSHLAPAILHHLEQLPVHVLDLPSLYAVSAKTPEESCAQIFREARRTSPSIIYIPHICHWWNVSTDTLRATFLTLLQDMEPTTPVLLLATSDESYNELSEQIHHLFEDFSGNVIHMRNPHSQARRDFFEDLFLVQATKPPSQKRKAATRALEVLPKAPPPEPRKLTEKESKRLHEQEEVTLRELRLFLRDVINRLARDRKFAIFTKPVDVDEVEDYYEVIVSPMDLATMMAKIDLHKYESADEFLLDINLICTNALEYNPDLNPTDRTIRHRACALRDLAHSIVKGELDPEFGQICEDIVASRERRGLSPTKTAPNFYHVKPLKLNPYSSTPELSESYPSRFSRRARGMGTETVPEVLNNKQVGSRDKQETESPNTSRNQSPKRKRQKVGHKLQSKRIIRLTREKYQELLKKRLKKSPWCKPTKNRNRWAPIYEIIDDEEEEKSEKSKNEEDEEETDKEKEETNDQVEEKMEEELAASSKPLRSPGSSKPNSPLGPGSRISFHSNSPRCTRPHSPASARSTSPGRAAPSRDRKDSGGELDLISEHSYSKSPDRSLRLDNSPRSVTVTEPLTIDTGNRNIPIMMNEDSNKENDPLITPLSPRISEGGDSRVGTSRKRKRSSSQSEMETEQTLPKVDEAPTGKVQASGSESSDNEITASPAMRITRSRLHNQQVAKAVDILDEPTPPLIVDKDALVALLEKAVELTHDYTVERLEKLHCLLAQSVFNYRQSYDKTELVEDMRKTLLKFTQHH